MSQSLALNPPPTSEELIVTFPADHVLQLTFNRPKSLNAMTPCMSDDVKRVLDWFEDEPQLWCARTTLMSIPLMPNLQLWSVHGHNRVVIVTGAGRVFCAGADLKASVDISNFKLDLFLSCEAIGESGADVASK